MPLGLPRLRVGLPLDEQRDIAPLATVGEPASPDELEAVFGIREIPLTEVTDHGSSLEKTAKARGFAHIFFGEPSIGGRYSVISPFGTRRSRSC